MRCMECDRPSLNLLEFLGKNFFAPSYISITIVPSYTGKYHEFVAVVLLRVRSTSNNAEGDKRVVCFRYSLVLW